MSVRAAGSVAKRTGSLGVLVGHYELECRSADLETEMDFELVILACYLFGFIKINWSCFVFEYNRHYCD